MYESIDSVVKGWLMNKGYSLHWYFRALKYAADCIQQLSFTTLKNVQTTLIDVDEFGQGDLPMGFVDYVKVGISVGQLIRPMAGSQNFNRLDNIDEYGNQQKRGFWLNDDWFNICDQQRSVEGFAVSKVTGKIQLSEKMYGKKVYMEYVTYMPCADLMTKIDPRAKFAVYAYIEWQAKSNNRSSGVGEVQVAQREYANQRTMLRGIMSDLTLEDIKQVFRESYYPQPKG